MYLKEKIKKFKYSSKKGYRLIFQILQPCWFIFKLFIDDRLRAEYFAKIKKNKLHYQVSTFTQNNRYPLIFEQCTKYLRFFAMPKILSFGCSTGEEVKTLNDYMPHATIIGVDINEWCINQCRKNNTSPFHFFYSRISKEFENLQDLDAIFCMAVFQRTENRVNKNNTKAIGFSFEQFEREIILLDSKLKLKGLFIIDNADFNFMDTLVANRYTPLNFINNLLLRNRPMFNKKNEKIAEQAFLCRVFVKNN